MLEIWQVSAHATGFCLSSFKAQELFVMGVSNCTGGQRGP